MAAILPQTIPFGAGGVDYTDAIDKVEPTRLTRMRNLVRLPHGEVQVRPGITSLATTAGNVHSVRRFNNPAAGSFTRIWGAGANLHRAVSGALGAAIDSGYSGNPLALVPFRVAISGSSWLFVADSSRWRKVDAAGNVLLVGLDAPVAALPVALASELTTVVEDFEAGFTGRIGTGAAPTITNPAGKDGNCLQIVTAFGTITSAYYNFADKGIGPIDLTSVGGQPASDDDFFHLWLRTDRPDLIADVKLYLTSSVFTGGILPGTSTTANTDGFVKTFRANDFNAVIDQQQGVRAGSDRVIGGRITDDGLRDRSFDDARTGTVQQRLAAIEASRAASRELNIGRYAWSEFGVVGVPLRRGDFQSFGSNADWSTIRGITVVVSVASAAAVTVQIDQLFLRGGRGLDSSEPGASQYDWRYTHYDTRTGAEGNPSPIMATANFLDSLRRAVTLSPASGGQASLRQRFYRRGGTLLDNWYFVGQNTADAATFSDTFADLAIQTAGTVKIDHDAPISTADANGATVSRQAVRALWGPVNGMLMACGDPNRPGDLYWSIPDEPDHWPAANHYTVCSPSEEAMNGFVYGDRGWIWTRLGLYQAVTDLGGSGRVVAIPTECRKGLAGYWAFALGAGAIWFVGVDGLYVTTGGAPTCVSHEAVWALFHNQTVNGVAPIDYSAANAIRLAVFDNEVWMIYQDTAAALKVMVYSILDQIWRGPDDYTPAMVMAHAEESGGASTLILGASGAAYTRGGTGDAGSPVVWTARTGSLDQGAPRAEKHYFDAAIDLDSAGQVVTITPYYNAEAASLAPQTITPAAGRRSQVIDLSAQGLLARNLAFDLSGSHTTVRPILYQLTFSVAAQAERVIQRGIDPEDLGDVLSTGLTLDLDTLGNTKTVEAFVDGVSQGTFSATTVGRQELHFVWPLTRGHLFRWQFNDAAEALVYDHKWHALPEPAEFLRAETDETSHGLDGWQTPVGIYVAIRSTAVVTLVLSIWNQTGVLSQQTFSIPSTAGVKEVLYLTPTAAKGVLFKYLFTAATPFRLYRHECYVVVQPWAAEQRVRVRVFGTDYPGRLTGGDPTISAGRPGGLI